MVAYATGWVAVILEFNVFIRVMAMDAPAPAGFPSLIHFEVLAGGFLGVLLGGIDSLRLKKKASGSDLQDQQRLIRRIRRNAIIMAISVSVLSLFVLGGNQILK